MHRGQFRTRLSPEGMIRGVSDGQNVRNWRLAARCARIINVSQNVISGMWNLHLNHRDPSHSHGEGRTSTGLQLNVRTGFVDSASTSTVSERYVLEKRVQERNLSAHFYTNSEKQTP